MKRLFWLAAYCCIILGAGAQTTPVFSPAAGSYAGSQMVTITSSTGARIFYTTDGSTPDYTSTPYTGPILVTASQTLKAIAGNIGSCLNGPGGLCQLVNESGSVPNGWSQPYCQGSGWNSGASYVTGQGVANGGKQWVAIANNTNKAPPNATYWQQSPCQADDPAGSGSNWPLTNSDPTSAIGGNPTGLISTCNLSPNGKCMDFTMTPAPGLGTDILWPNKTLHCNGTCPTWTVSDKWEEFTDNPTKATAYENDSQIYDNQDTPSNYPHGINFQFGMQCKACTTNSANWQIGGYSGLGWTSTGVTTPVVANVWHHVVTENHRVASEVTSLPCSNNGHAAPCQYWTALVIDGVHNNLLKSGACGQSAGCKFGAYPLSSGFSQLIGDQYQIDANTSSSGQTVNFRIDSATFTAYGDPSAVSTAAYSINSLSATLPFTVTSATPTLLSTYLTAPGSPTTLAIGGTLQFSVFCHYSSGPDQNCTGTDLYGDVATSFTSSNTATVTIQGISHPNPGLAAGVAAGSVNITAAVNHTVVTPNYPLTVPAATVTLTAVSLATTGGVTGLFVGSTNQLVATCVYSDSSTTNCTSTDSHGNVAGTYASSSTGHATVNATTGLVTGIGAGSTNLTASAGAVNSPNLPLTVLAVPTGIYNITITGPVTFTGSVNF